MRGLDFREREAVSDIGGGVGVVERVSRGLRSFSVQNPLKIKSKISLKMRAKFRDLKRKSERFFEVEVVP